MGNECTKKNRNDGESFKNRCDMSRIEIDDNTSNEAIMYECNECGCNNCGEPLMLRNCRYCDILLCRCHMLPEKHGCIPINRGWETYAKLQQKFK